MFAVYIPVRRARLMELYEFLDLHEPEWLYYNTYDNAACSRERHEKVRASNEQFIRACDRESMGMDAAFSVCVSGKAAMALRLAWPDVTVMDLQTTDHPTMVKT